MNFLARPVLRRITIALIIFLPASGAALAVQVEAVQEDGVIQIDGGQKIELAGIEMTPESIPLLKVLIENQDVEVDFGASAGADTAAEPMTPFKQDASQAYVYVVTREMRLPFAPQSQPLQKTVLVNRLLLQLGAAKVAGHLPDKWRDDFMKAQSDAQKAGEGMWSYASLEKGAVSF